MVHKLQDVLNETKDSYWVFQGGSIVIETEKVPKYLGLIDFAVKKQIGKMLFLNLLRKKDS